MQFKSVIKHECPCWNLKPGNTVKVRGWVPHAKIISMQAHDWSDHRVTVQYDTVTAHIVEYRCHELEKICPLEELAKI